MRKFFIPLLMVSAAMPVVANAQWRSGDRDAKAERVNDARGEKPQRAERPQRTEQTERAERPQRVERPDAPRPSFDRAMRERPAVEVERQRPSHPQVQINRPQEAPRVTDVRPADRTPRADGDRRGWDGYRDRVINQGQVTNTTQNRDRNWRDRDGRDRDGRWDGNRDFQRWANRDGSWSNRWRTDNRYDWRRYRDRNRTTFRLGVYFDPYGYNYRRFNIGYNMWPSYYQSNYWIQDPWMYRLPEVWGPYRWVRYYNDALLVNIYTGQVEDVLYNFFW